MLWPIGETSDKGCKMKKSFLQIVNNLIFGLLILSICNCCDPYLYLTTKLNSISKENEKDSIYVTYPIIECRRQVTKDSFFVETEALRVADTLTRKALHQLLGKQLPIKFAELNSDGLWKTKNLLDSILSK